MNLSKIWELTLTLISELTIAIAVAGVAPFLVRYLLLPSSVHHQYPLNIIFHTCSHDLHSVCSFPSASLQYDEAELFSPNVAYYLNIRLKFADVATTNRLGLFQNVISFHDENGKVLKTLNKSAYVKEPGIFTKAMQLFFFPLYILGFFHDYSVLDVPMSSSYLEYDEMSSVSLTYALQDKFANVEEAELIVTARFGLIRHLLYWWPTTSYFIIFFVTFSGIFTILLAKWAYFNFGIKEASEDIEKEVKTAEKLKRSEKKVKIEKELAKEVENEDGFAVDEWCPDTFGEEPEPVYLGDIGVLKKRK